jgi:hypothetical protein
MQLGGYLGITQICALANERCSLAATWVLPKYVRSPMRDAEGPHRKLGPLGIPASSKFLKVQFLLKHLIALMPV